MKSTIFLLIHTLITIKQNVVNSLTFRIQKPNPTLFSSHQDKETTVTNSAILTYLEMNGYILTTSSTTILIDPILQGDLDFGIPQIYKAKKTTLPRMIAPPVDDLDCLLLTQGLDDHAHFPTLKKLGETISSRENKEKSDRILTIIAPPSARPVLDDCGLMDSSKVRVRLTSHGDVLTVNNNKNDGSGVQIQVTPGALVGPPWQDRENGYIIRPSTTTTSTTTPSFYIEPHADIPSPSDLRSMGPVDVCIVPVIGQSLLSLYDLVHGPNDSLEIVRCLQPDVVIPMRNDLSEKEGLGADIVNEVGSREEFLCGMKGADWGRGIEFVDLDPGMDIVIEK